VYRQVLELLHGVRDEAATRALIVQENMRYARRQRLWFEKETDVRWLTENAEGSEVTERAIRLVGEFLAAQ